ncbi:MAG: OadG family protein [Clostridia bacterium]|nr:OadG family protein [Clostridia bacterium]
MRFILPLTESVGAAANDISAVPEDVFGKLMYGFNTALIGLGTVFAVLLILMAVLYVFKFVFAKNSNTKTQKTDEPVKTASISSPSSAGDSEDELIPVVIAAAVAAYMENTAPRSKYRIRSFKRI